MRTTSRGFASAGVTAIVGVSLVLIAGTSAGAAATGTTPAGRVVAVTATPTATSTPTPTPTPTTSTPAPRPSVVRAVPKHSGTGRRIVYSERTPQHAWLIDSNGKVVRDFPVSGRKHWPRTGTYRVFSKSPRSYSTTYGVSFRWMVRFAQGHNASIGFHTIPRYASGKKMQRLSQLGQPVGRGGCPHSADPDAKFLYRWASIGTKVVVVR